MAFFLFSSLLPLISASGIQSSTYTCPANEPCFVNCSSTQFNCTSDGIFAVINALDASSLNVHCHEPNICSRLALECPITSQPSSCTLHCQQSNSCNTIQIKTHNSSNVSLLCGPHNYTCHNMFIYGMYALELDIPPKTQNISIECGAFDEQSPSCDLICCVTLNIFCSFSSIFTFAHVHTQMHRVWVK